MKIIAFSGLGADHRVFQELTLDFPLEVVHWQEGFQNLSLTEYAKLLSDKILQDDRICLIGVSFGGVIAQEVAQIINVEKIILISSLESNKELPWPGFLVGKLRILNLLPKYFFKPPKKIAKYLFGTKNTKLLNEILDDTDLEFAKWATDKLTQWKGVTNKIPITRIHGTKDKLIDCPKSKKTIKIDGAGHFMIVDHATELSSIINSNIFSR